MGRGGPGLEIDRAWEWGRGAVGGALQQDGLEAGLYLPWILTLCSHTWLIPKLTVFLISGVIWIPNGAVNKVKSLAVKWSRGQEAPRKCLKYNTEKTEAEPVSSVFRDRGMYFILGNHDVWYTWCEDWLLEELKWFLFCSKYYCASYSTHRLSKKLRMTSHSNPMSSRCPVLGF